VKNGTYSSTACPTSYQGTSLSMSGDVCVDSAGSIYEITQTKNDNNIVHIKGFEVNWQQSLDQWSPIKGFGIITNYTYVQPSSNTSGFYLANLSKNTANFTAYWENKIFSARLSANYRSAYNQTSAESFFATENHTIEARTQYDVTLGYNLSDRLSLTLAGLNITNAQEKAYKDIKTRWQMTSIVGAAYYASLQYKFY
jgi:TonB-dependent receptor